MTTHTVSATISEVSFAIKEIISSILDVSTVHIGRKNNVMTPEEKKMLNRINEYADTVLKDYDPQKTRVSFQLDKIKPIMEEIAKEQNVSIEDIFIKYMDLASQATVESNTKFQESLGDLSDMNR